MKLESLLRVLHLFLKKKKKSQSKDLSLSKKQKQCAKKKIYMIHTKFESLKYFFSLSSR